MNGNSLLVEDVEYGVGEDDDLLVLGDVEPLVEGPGEVLRQAPGPAQGVVVVLGRLEDGVKCHERHSLDVITLESGIRADAQLALLVGNQADGVTVGCVARRGAAGVGVLLQEQLKVRPEHVFRDTFLVVNVAPLLVASGTVYKEVQKS